MDQQAKKITVQSTIDAPVKKVWDYFTDAQHIKKWNAASPDWHTPAADNDLREGGKFTYRMEAKDGSFGFDFGGIYDAVKPNEKIAYTLGDGRKVIVDFSEQGEKTTIKEEFDAETQNSAEMQQQGWQAILDNFKNYTENN